MKVYRWLLRLLPRRFRDDEGAEILATAEEQVREAAAAGPFARARVAAALTGDVVGLAWSLRVAAFRNSVVKDVRYAWRRLRRSPGFTVVAVLTLAIGIGANTTVFSLVNAFYFQPSEFPDPATLVELGETSQTQLCAGCGVGTSYPGYLDWRARLKSFTALEAYEEDRFVLSAPLLPAQISGARVTSGLFDTLGIAPIAGRPFRADDDRPGAPLVVILGHRVWQRDFSGSTTAIGRVVRVNGVPAEIIGVMRPQFGFPQFADLWVPMQSAPPSTDRTDRRYGVVARVRSGVTMAQAAAEVHAVAAALEREYPAEQREWSAGVQRLGADRAGQEGEAFVVMLGAVGLVLAIACANLAALFLARASARQRELTVRAALGAGRGRLVRQLLTEHLALGVAGGLVGLALAWWGVRFAALNFISEVPYYIQFAIDWRVLTFCALLSILASVVAGLGPALSATRTDFVSALKFGGSTQGLAPRQARLRQILIVGEVALVLVLLSAAGLMGRTFLRFFRAPAGYDLRGLTIADLPLAGARLASEATRRSMLRDFTDRLEAIPGVDAALESTTFVAGFGTTDRQIAVEGMASVPAGGSPRFAHGVSSRYFATKGLAIVAGRGFTAGDRAGSLAVVVVNKLMADTIWPGRSPLGARLKLSQDPAAPWWTVVGVAANSDGEPAPGRRVNAYAYVPLDQMPGRPLRLFLRTNADLVTVLPRVRAALGEVDPDEPLNDVHSAEVEHARAYWFVGYFASFYAAFGAFALLLAIVGVYGVVAQAVSERMREFGIRLALGADRARLYRLVLGRTLRLTTIGVGIGLFAAMLTTRFLRYLLFGADPKDPAVFGVVGVVLAVATLGASYLPARRAARVDPIVVLKSE